MSGIVSVSVNGSTAQWDNNITVLQTPLITSIRPHSALLNSTVSLSVTGANLGGANFIFNSPLVVINSATASPEGTSVVLSVTAGAIGHYALAATNGSGNSTFIILPSNSFCVSSGSDGVDLDGDGLSDAQEIAIGTDACHADTDGDGFSDGVEVATGSDPLDPNATPLNSRVPGEGYPAFVSVLNPANGITGSVYNELDTFVSVLNTSSAVTNTPNEVNTSTLAAEEVVALSDSFQIRSRSHTVPFWMYAALSLAETRDSGGWKRSTLISSALLLDLGRNPRLSAWRFLKAALLMSKSSALLACQ